MNQTKDASEKFLVGVVEISIDIDKVIRDCLEILETYKLEQTQMHDFTKPYSIILSNDGQSSVPNNDLVEYAKVHDQKFFDRDQPANLKNIYADTSLAQLVSQLPFPFSIMRLSILPPNTIIGMHTDDSCHAQLAIITNDDCFVAARNGETKHIPVDGKLYIISTTLPHTAFNASSNERIHLSISIYDEDYVRLLRGELVSNQ